jgi:pilus assembly protein Flp/PilA
MIQYLTCRMGLGERGQGLAEYALILALIAVLAIAAVTFLGGQIRTVLSNVGNKI